MVEKGICKKGVLDSYKTYYYDLLREQNIWKENVINTSLLNLSRWIDSEVPELHIFADASNITCGATAYIKIVRQNSLNSTSCSLVIRKPNLQSRS